jgi:anti-anti-sigma factor
MIRGHRVEDDGTHVLFVGGDIDTATAPTLQETLDGLIDGGARHIVLGVRGVEFMDSSGLVVLVSVANRLRKLAGDLRLAVPSPQVRSVVALTRMDRVFPLFDSLDEALGRPSAGDEA